MDEELYAALLKADRSESLAPLAAGMAREINDSLTKILGAVSEARGKSPHPALEDAEKACLEARELTRRLQGLGREGGADRTVVPVRELLDEAAATAGAGSAVEIAVDVPFGVDPVQVDREPLLQVFRALVRNAVEAMSPPPRRPRVYLRAANATLAEGQVAELPAGDYVEFEVRDNGSGIAPENLEKIWQTYFTTKVHRAGLGLPAALAIVRRHGGQIGVDSKVGDGSVFTVFLPRASAPTQIRAQAAPTQRFRTGRILVMDADERILAFTASMLQKLSYKADLAKDGEEAVAAYRRYFDVGRPHDAVILGLGVPGGMGGEEAFARLRESDPDVRAIASSGAEDAGIEARCREAGFCGWLARPYTQDELGKVLGTVLS